MKILLLNNREPFDETLISDALSHHEIIFYQTSPEAFNLEHIAKTHHDADVIISTYNDLSAAILAKFSQLKIIIATTTANEYIDKEYAKNNNILVFNNPGYTQTAVAEHLLALTLATARRIPLLDKEVKAGDFKQFDQQGFELAGKKLGILGMGNIGQTFAKIASSLNMNIAYFNRSEKTLPYQQLPLLELLSQSDILAITLPLTDETQNIINAKTLGAMKPGSIISSISPDGVFDIHDLSQALETKLFGAGLDLHHPHPDLYKLNNVVITPTKAWYTAECMQRRTLSWINTLKTQLEQLQA